MIKIMPDNIICLHEHGVMIPQQDEHGNYIKPEYMLCECRAVIERKDDPKPVWDGVNSN